MLKLNRLKENRSWKRITTLDHMMLCDVTGLSPPPRAFINVRSAFCHVTRWSFPVRRSPGKAEDKWQQTVSRCCTCWQVYIPSWWRGRKETKEEKSKWTEPESWSIWAAQRSSCPGVAFVRCPPAVPVALDPPVLCGFSPFIAESCLEFPQKRLKPALNTVTVAGTAEFLLSKFGNWSAVEPNQTFITFMSLQSRFTEKIL